jgi:glycosyltransferase 2 family protein
LQSPGINSPRKLQIPLLIGGKIVLASVLLGYVFSKINIAEAAHRIEQSFSPSLITAAALALIIPCVLALRWWVLARPVVGWSDALAFTWIGCFYSLILPGAISGDIAKGGLLALRSSRARQAALPASILADRLVGLAVMLLFFCLSSLLVLANSASPELARFALPAAGIGALAFFALLLGWTKPFQRLALALLEYLPWKPARSGFQGFVEATYDFAGKPGRLGQAAILSICAQGLSVAMYAALLHSLTIHFGLIPVFALYSIIAVLGLAPITFAGIGLRDWFAVGFFSANHLAPEAGVAFAWLCLAMTVLQALVGGVCQLALSLVRKPSPVSGM